MNKLFLITVALTLVTSVYPQEKKYTWEELQDKFECPKWFKNARFGIWCHWGAQTQPEQGGGWYARHMYMPDVGNQQWGKNAYPYHCKKYGHPSEIGYKDVINSWKAEHLDTDALMRYFKKIGARYFMILANHHDHFDNFNSTYHEWNSVNVGPHRDIVGEFAKSAKKYKMPFGVSSHDDRYLDWWLPAFGHDEKGPFAGKPYDGNMTKADGKGKWWEGLDPANLYGLPPEKRTPEWIEEMKKNWVKRHIELVTKYDVDMLWFDGYGFPYQEYGKEVCTAFYNHCIEKDGKINGVIVAKIADEPIVLKDVERGGANEILPQVWQGTLTPAGSWFYKYDSELEHNARTIIEMMVDINSKNGNFLMNVELLADGTIPPEQKPIIDSVGNWVNINKEAIYASKPWVIYGDNLNSIFKRLKSQGNATETDLEALKNNDNKKEQFNQRTIKSPQYGNDEVRFTTKGKNLYVFVLNPKAGIIKIPSLGLETNYNTSEIKKIELLGCSNKIEFKQEKSELKLNVPEKRPTEYTAVFKIDFYK